MIILVEDDEGLRLSMSDFLTYLNLEHRTATSNKEAILLLDQFCPAILLADFKLKGENSMAVIDHCKNHHKDCKVILFTAMKESDAKDIAHKINADALILKPFDINDLENTLKTYL